MIGWCLFVVREREGREQYKGGDVEGSEEGWWERKQANVPALEQPREGGDDDVVFRATDCVVCCRGILNSCGSEMYL
jgi:hypothetical protein